MFITFIKINIIMTLSIYTINHPLVQHWSSYILNVSNAKNEQKNIISQIFLILLYESTRKSTELINLYLNKLEYITEINLIDRKKTNLIFSEIYLTEILGKNIYQFFPEAQILSFQIINLNKNKHYIKFDDLSSFFQLNTHVIIIEQYLDLNSVSRIINLIDCTQYVIKKIQIICLMCSNEILQIINKKYNNINITIYTITIIENNNNTEIQYLLNKIFG
uniref:Uracil phosphoribosyltransferase n=1 Tax=Kumanoa mahlacensis TaxID=1196387 RepID=A0A8K1YUF5_9FLOR|nr:uracil phosphoribosyltransferase [Kumanoa mahlacensis]